MLLPYHNFPIIIIIIIIIIITVFQDRVSLCTLGCPGTHSVDQAGLEPRNLSASASQVLGLKVCTTTARPQFLFSTPIPLPKKEREDERKDRNP